MVDLAAAVRIGTEELHFTLVAQVQLIKVLQEVVVTIQQHHFTVLVVVVVLVQLAAVQQPRHPLSLATEAQAFHRQ